MTITPLQTGSGLFIAAGHNGLRLVSEDGRTWRDAQLGKEGETYRCSACGNGRAVVIGSYGGNNIFAATEDGTTWKTATQDAKYSLYIRNVLFAKNRFLAVGGDPGSVGGSRPFALVSTDGLEWGHIIELAGKHIIRRIAHGNGLYVGVGDRGRRCYSRDGLVWEDVPDVKALDTLVDVTYGNGVFVGVGLHGLRMTTTDGRDWSDRQTGEEGEHLNSVLWTGDRFVAIGAGATYTSPDGHDWQRHPNHDAPLIAIHRDGQFLGTKWKGRVMHSTDAIRWQEVHKAEHHIETLIACGPAA